RDAGGLAAERVRGRLADARREVELGADGRRHLVAHLCALGPQVGEGVTRRSQRLGDRLASPCDVSERDPLDLSTGRAPADIAALSEPREQIGAAGPRALVLRVEDALRSLLGAELDLEVAASLLLGVGAREQPERLLARLL